LAVGLLDDRKELGAMPKLFIQILAAALLVFWGGMVLTDLGTWPGGTPMSLGWLAIPITLLGMVGFVNALNMIDGLDGLAGGTVWVMLGWLATAALHAGATQQAQVALVLMAAVTGFLLFNLRSPLRHRASVFLGDAGSLILGLAVIWLAFTLASLPGRVISPWGIAWVVVLPVLDTLSLFVRRMLRGRSPLDADRNHLHHILERAGFTHGQSAAMLIALNAGLGAIGVVGSSVGVPDVVLASALIAVASAHYLFVRYAWRSTRALRRLRGWALMRAGTMTPADRIALLAFYLTALSLPFGAERLVWVAGGLLGIATLLALPKVWGDLKGLALTWVAIASAVWLIVAVMSRLGPTQPVLMQFIWLTGVLALPVGWWLARLKHHAVGFFAMLTVAILAATMLSANWQMLEAGFIQNPRYWGDPRTGGLLLALLLMPLVVSYYRQRWRARAALVLALGLAAVMLTLLVALQLHSAILAALVGLVVMAAAMLLSRRLRRSRQGVMVGAVLMLGLAVAAAQFFKPADSHLTDQYLSPIQSAFLYLGGQRSLAAAQHPMVASRLDAWRYSAHAFLAQPLRGHGQPLPYDRNERVYPRWDAMHSAYVGLTLTTGLVGLALFLTFLCLLARAMHRAGRKRVWQPGQVVVGYGLLAVVSSLMLLVPVIANPMSAALLTGVFGLGVAAVERQ
jgi:UDP-GlcNAc:undecaprenyl-phosphate GlcNAc-1-phosphate transferase